MEVHITFIGLCLFVPDPNGRQVHVLLPESGISHRHVPSVTWLGLNGTPTTFSRYYLDLSALHQGGSSHPLDNVLDVEAMVGAKVPPDAIGADTRQKVAVRITLPLADSVSSGPMAEWEVETKAGQVTYVHLTHQLTWKIANGDIAFVNWERYPLFGAGSGSEKLDEPIADPGGVVRIYVSHLADHKHIVMPGHPAPHPNLFYGLSGGTGKPPVLERLTARLQAQIVTFPQRKGPCLSETAYNCMLGKSG